MSKYAVFVDDGLDSVCDTKDEAKSYAMEIRSKLRAEGCKDSCYIKKMTREQEEMFNC